MLSVDEEDEISKKFPSIDWETTHKWIILIQMKNLSRTHINDEFFNKMEDTLLSRRLIRNLSKAKLFECSVKYSSIENFEAYTLILPDKWKYNFNGGYFKNYKSKERIGEVADFGDKQLDKYLPVTSNMKIQSINMQEYLESSDFIFIISILSLESTKDTLKQLNLYIKYISEAIQVLDLCSKCKNIEDVNLSYETKDLTDKSIKDELDRFLSKTGVYVDINVKKSSKINLF